MIVVGLMSGTSADGTDVALVDIEGAPPSLRWQLIHHGTVPHPAGIRAAILSATQAETGTVAALSALNVALGEQFARVALTAIEEAGLRPAEVQLVGSHGQTVWHAPEDTPPSTLQVGEAAVIAERLGAPVVSNFRLRDMAAGGQGAPLAAYVHTLLLTDPGQVRAVQNIGGIANVTFLPPPNRPELAPLAFDTGPGNVLLDHAAARITQGRLQYDRDGALAQQGRVDTALLGRLLRQPYFARRPPKSTGRELFTHAFAQAVWQQAEAMGLPPLDIIATLTAYTAQTIGRAYRDFLPCRPEEVIVSGGGAHNPTLMRMLADAVYPAPVRPSDAIGIPGQAMEALAFAVLAYESWHGRPGNLPAATGAGRRVVLGQITAGRP